MEIKYQLSMLQARATTNPTGRAAQFLARGRVEGEVVAVEEAVHRDVLAKFPQKLPFEYSVEKLRMSDRLRPVGFADFILARGKIEGDIVILDQATHRELRYRFYPPAKAPRPIAPPKDPTLTELAGNFALAMTGWAKAGFKTVTREEFERRHTLCQACEYYEPNARLGLGKCKRCACSKFKLWLATSHCPDFPPRW